MDIFAGIDVGTGSARAGLFTREGKLIASAKRDIRIWKDGGDFVEQSSADIWSAISQALQEAMRIGKVEAGDVKGVGFDATCSLVILGRDGQPLAAGPSGDAQRNIIVWMDHRANAQADRINETRHTVLDYVGGRISPEMQLPKLLWLKEHNRATFDTAEHFFDLADYLTYRATGSLKRSLCTVVCKWTYLGHERRWDGDFFHLIDLEELADEGFVRIGSEVCDIAEPLGSGLTEAAASDLGLLPGTAVGAALIDAHAGGVGTIAGRSQDGAAADPTTRLALIMGTSACAMAVTQEPAFVDGVWGPYYSAMLPGLWLNEGGQSAFGAALDHLIAMHPAAEAVREEARKQGVSLPDHLERLAVRRAGSLEKAAMLARSIHVVPEFLGNRSPDADPAASAVIAGLRLDTSIESLVDLFVAGLCGLTYGTADILEAMTRKGIPIRTLVVSGGAARSALFRRILADGTGYEVALPSSSEPVLLGAAIVGASAFEGTVLGTVAASMSEISETIVPQKGDMAEFHAAKRDIHRDLKALEKAMRARMSRFGD